MKHGGTIVGRACQGWALSWDRSKSVQGTGGLRGKTSRRWQPWQSRLLPFLPKGGHVLLRKGVL